MASFRINRFGQWGTLLRTNVGPVYIDADDFHSFRHVVMTSQLGSGRAFSLSLVNNDFLVFTSGSKNGAAKSFALVVLFLRECIL